MIRYLNFRFTTQKNIVFLDLPEDGSVYNIDSKGKLCKDNIECNVDMEFPNGIVLGHLNDVFNKEIFLLYQKLSKTLSKNPLIVLK